MGTIDRGAILGGRGRAVCNDRTAPDLDATTSDEPARRQI